MEKSGITESGGIPGPSHPNPSGIPSDRPDPLDPSEFPARRGREGPQIQGILSGGKSGIWIRGQKKNREGGGRMHSQGKNSFQSFSPDGFRGIRRRSRIPNPRNADPTKGIPEFSKGNPPGTEPEAAFPAVPGIPRSQKKIWDLWERLLPLRNPAGNSLRALGSSQNSQDGEFPPAGALKPPGIPEFPWIRREKSRHGAVFHGKTQIPARGTSEPPRAFPGIRSWRIRGNFSRIFRWDCPAHPCPWKSSGIAREPGKVGNPKVWILGIDRIRRKTPG